VLTLDRGCAPVLTCASLPGYSEDRQAVGFFAGVDELAARVVGGAAERLHRASNGHFIVDFSMDSIGWDLTANVGACE
jgi:hypothetical protein